MKAILSLSENAYITDAQGMLAKLLSYYILSDAAQSIAFQDKIINLPGTYYNFINDPDGMAIGVKNDLDKLLSNYFISVDVETQVKEITKKKHAILLYVSVVDENSIKYSLSKITEINTNGVRKVIDLSNYGDGLQYLNAIR